MALVLSLRQGEDFYVEDERFIVVEIFGPSRFQLKDAETGSIHEVTDEERVEILDDVFVSAGDRTQMGVARIAIEAPREIMILRGEKYREG